MKLFKQKRIYVVFFPTVLVGVILAVFLGMQSNEKEITTDNKVSIEKYPELQEFVAHEEADFGDASRFFSKLAEARGARYALDAMKVAPFPPNIDMHLLAHVAGDILFKQEGVKGMEACTNDFRNACSHSIVVGLFNEKGEGAFGEIAGLCRTAPGGMGAYTMCFHGLGHGILSSVGYDFPKAVQLCEKTRTNEAGRESIECIGGASMEMFGGVHDVKTRLAQIKKLVTTKDPISFCSKYIPSITDRPLCLLYITPYLFELAGANLASPSPADFEKAFTYCAKLPATARQEREFCFGGFGKEFIGIVQGRDIRHESLANMNEGQLQTIYDWCRLAHDKEGILHCVVYATNSLYWGGENDVGLPIRFCTLISDRNYRGPCFMNLIGAIEFYSQGAFDKDAICVLFPKEFKDQCFRTYLLSNAVTSMIKIRCENCVF